MEWVSIHPDTSLVPGAKYRLWLTWPGVQLSDAGTAASFQSAFNAVVERYRPSAVSTKRPKATCESVSDPAGENTAYAIITFHGSDQMETGKLLTTTAILAGTVIASWIQIEDIEVQIETSGGQVSTTPKKETESSLAAKGLGVAAMAILGYLAVKWYKGT